jgi:hypothetical protein
MSYSLILKEILEAFAGVKFDPFSFEDFDRLTGFRIPAFAGHPPFDLETAEPRKGHPVPVFKGIFDSLEEGRKGFFGLVEVQAGIFGDPGDRLFFVHLPPPFVNFPLC